MRDFRDLVVWQQSHALTLDVYKATRAFPRDELFGLTSQLRRAVSSIPANIAEGNGRGTRKDYLKFLIIARGSLNEARYHVILAADLEYLSRSDHDRMESQFGNVSRLLAGLIRSLRRKK
jgi:four helix bundle protein